MSFYPEKGGRGVNPSRPKAARARQLKDGVKARTPQSWNSANSGPPAGCPRFRAGLSALTWVVANPSFVCLGGAVQVLESAIHFAYLGASSTISRHYVPWGLKRFHAGLCAHPGGLGVEQFSPLRNRQRGARGDRIRMDCETTRATEGTALPQLLLLRD